MGVRKNTPELFPLGTFAAFQLFNALSTQPRRFEGNPLIFTLMRAFCYHVAARLEGSGLVHGGFCALVRLFGSREKLKRHAMRIQESTSEE